MAKFLKRIGTTAEKFALELILDKVEMKIVKDARVSISFKRGGIFCPISSGNNLISQEIAKLTLKTLLP